MVGLDRLMRLTAGADSINVALIDGPVDVSHPQLATDRLRQPRERAGATCGTRTSFGCVHGTGVAGILHRHRDQTGEGICPGCGLVLCVIFPPAADRPIEQTDTVPTATPMDLAATLVAAVEANAHVVNISAGLVGFPPLSSERAAVTEALNYAASRGSIVVAAAGNEAHVGSSVLTRHPWVIPVVAVALDGRPIPQTNLGNSIGRRGLAAPGEAIETLAPEGSMQTLSGSSAATPFVTGAIALLRSLVAKAPAGEILAALRSSHHPAQSRRRIFPPPFDAWRAYEQLKARYGTS